MGEPRRAPAIPMQRAADAGRDAVGQLGKAAVEHGAALVDEQGLAALSMRTLAGALGTGPMTLYNYVKDRDDLDALVVEAVLAEISRPRSRGDWQHDVRAIVEATWRTVRRHPNVIPLVLTRRTLHETTLDWAEGLLDALARGGRSGAELLIAFRTVSGFVMGLAQAQLTQANPSGLFWAHNAFAPRTGTRSRRRA